MLNAPIDTLDERPVSRLAGEPIQLSEARLRSWHPNHLSNMAYGVYAYEDPDQSGTTWEELGKKDAVLLMHGEALTENCQIYLDTVRDIVLSYSRTLYRGKRQWKKEVNAAQRRYETNQEWKRSTRVQSFWQNMTMLALRTAFVFGLGVAVAAALSGFIPVRISDKTGDVAPTVVAGFALVAIKNLISKLWSDLRASRMESDFDWSNARAEEDYELAQRDAFRLHWDQLCRAYRQFTGEDYEHIPSFMSIIEGNLRNRTRWRIRSYFRTMGNVAWILVFIRKVILKTLRRDRKRMQEHV
jgi:hypothetical protein